MTGEKLASLVDRDPMLGGDEKETTLTMCGQDKHFSIYSAKPTVIKSLLKHDHFEIEWARVIDGDSGKRIKERSKLLDISGDIVAVEGKMPIGTLTVKSKPRANDHQSSIVNSETIDSSVFD
ncbi:hypothetical protein [Haloarcula sp. 1CSR25-25]|uniref:hypothetical protein n=1 Tax=Haloarcula sp. 1CSR25-25 TaxID=2862545 RepID=UPI002893F236|nr:hypothetical protein [Haloarcula sp. 1CSR25-25]MDT3434679.1 hypothetical protein [Haloarcula sp. 1CSR25-25]